MRINGEHVGSAEEGSGCSVQKGVKTRLIIFASCLKVP